MDKFQTRYINHQKRKKNTLTSLVEPNFKRSETILDVIKNRRSRRVYNRGILDNQLDKIIEISKYSPSSCNRKAVSVKKISSKLSNQLVGAIEWHKKGTVIGLFADMNAYKSQWEVDYMPYLDAGVMAQTILLYCEYKKIKACFINPNTHGKYNGKKRFCGAIAMGK